MPCFSETNFVVPFCNEVIENKPYRVKSRTANYLQATNYMTDNKCSNHANKNLYTLTQGVVTKFSLNL